MTTEALVVSESSRTNLTKLCLKCVNLTHVMKPKKRNDELSILISMHFLPVSLVHSMTTSLDLANNIILFSMSGRVFIEVVFSLKHCRAAVTSEKTITTFRLFGLSFLTWFSVEYLRSISAKYDEFMSNDEMSTKKSLSLEWFQADFA